MEENVMTQEQIYKKLEEIEKQVKYLKNQLKNNDQQELGPVQKAVKTVTCSKSTVEQVKDALQVLVESPQGMSVKQATFVLYFAFLNKNELGDDINYWFDIQIGKHKYTERTSFIEEMQSIIKSNYKTNATFSQKLCGYLDSKKK